MLEITKKILDIYIHKTNLICKKYYTKRKIYGNIYKNISK